MTHHASPMPRWLARLLHVALRIFPRSSPPPNWVYPFHKSGLPFTQIGPTLQENQVCPFSTTKKAKDKALWEVSYDAVWHFRKPMIDSRIKAPK